MLQKMPLTFPLRGSQKLNLYSTWSSSLWNFLFQEQKGDDYPIIVYLANEPMVSIYKSHFYL